MRVMVFAKTTEDSEKGAATRGNGHFSSHGLTPATARADSLFLSGSLKLV